MKNNGTVTCFQSTQTYVFVWMSVRSIQFVSTEKTRRQSRRQRRQHRQPQQIQRAKKTHERKSFKNERKKQSNKTKDVCEFIRCTQRKTHAYIFACIRCASVRMFVWMFVCVHAASVVEKGSLSKWNSRAWNEVIDLSVCCFFVIPSLSFCLCPWIVVHWIISVDKHNCLFYTVRVAVHVSSIYTIFLLFYHFTPSSSSLFPREATIFQQPHCRHSNANRFHWTNMSAPSTEMLPCMSVRVTVHTSMYVCFARKCGLLLVERYWWYERVRQR